jgi:hypothetical protein
MKLFKVVKTDFAFVQKLLGAGIPLKKVKNTVALLHWLVSFQRYNLKNKKTVHLKGSEIFPVSRAVFKKYLHNTYPTILKTLKDMGYIASDNFYRYAVNDGDEIKRKYYGPTPLLIKELSIHAEEYLNKVMASAEVRAASEKARKTNLKILGKHKFKGALEKNEFANEVKADWFERWDEISKVLDQLSKNKAVANRGYLIDLIEGRVDKDRRRSVKTGRIYTKMNNVSSIIRQYAVIEGKRFSMDIDLRSCHLSLLADFFYNLNPSEDLKKERDLWRAVFEQNEHPRKYFARMAGMKEENVKRHTLSWINGKRFPEFDKYMAEYWPLIWKAYSKYDQKKLGNDLSRTIESEIFRSNWVFKLQEEHNVVTVNTHDGLMIWGDQVDATKFSTAFILKTREMMGWKIYFTFSTDYKLNTDEQIRGLQDKIQAATETGDLEQVKEFELLLCDAISKQMKDRAEKGYI